MKKIISILMALAILFGMTVFSVSCEKTEDKGKVLVSYDGGAVYEKDIEDWINYYVLSQYAERVDSASDEGYEINSIADEAALRYAVNMMTAKRLEELSMYSRSQIAIDTFVSQFIASCNETYANDGGYEHYKEQMMVSDDFVYSLAEFNLILDSLQEYLRIINPITDEDITDYWQAYAGSYVTPPSVRFDIIFFDIPDASYEDEAVWDSTKAEAEDYIAKIKSGEISFDDAKSEVVAKCSEYGKTSEVYSTISSVLLTDLVGFEDESCLQQNIDDFFAVCSTIFKDVEFKKYVNIGDNTNESEYWFMYAQMMNEIHTKYAMNSCADGEVFGEAVLHPDGYMILKRVEKNEDPIWDRPENNEQLRNEITNAIWDSRWGGGDGPAAIRFYNEIMDMYHAKVEFSYLDNYLQLMGKTA